MRYTLALLCVLFAGLPVVAQDAPAPAKKKTKITAPKFSDAKPKAADDVEKLMPDTWCVFQADAPCIVLVSSTSDPAGEVTKLIITEQGTGWLLGKFTDPKEPGKPELRKFNSKWVAAIQPLKAGRVEVMIVPPDAKTEADALRKTIDVYTQAPQPPPDVDPKPEPEPEPAPEPPPPKPVTGIRVLMLYDYTQPRTADQEAAINHGGGIAEWLTRNVARDGGVQEWRTWDTSTVTQNLAKVPQVWRDLWQDSQTEIAKKKLVGKPCMVVTSDQRGDVYPIESTKQVLGILKTYGDK